jgi:hypothetical protein
LQSLLKRNGDELETHYRHVLESLGKRKGDARRQSTWKTPWKRAKYALREVNLDEG